MISTRLVEAKEVREEGVSFVDDEQVWKNVIMSFDVLSKVSCKQQKSRQR